MQLLAIFAGAALLVAAQVPAYATPANETTLAGTIAGFDGKYHLRLREEHGAVDDVLLHQGTLITPTGERLRPGMRVTIRAVANGSTFDADEIDIFTEDVTGSGDYSGPYRPLIVNGVACNTWDCTYNASPGYYGYPSYPGYYDVGWYSNYYGYPYYWVPQVIVVPSQSTPQPQPSPYHLRRPLNAPAFVTPAQPVPRSVVAPPAFRSVVAPPAVRSVLAPPAYRAPAPPQMRVIMAHPVFPSHR